MRLTLAIAAGLVCWAPGLALADGLSDLKAALARNQGLAPVTGVLDARVDRVHGEGKDAEEQAGEVALQVDAGAQGLRLAYSRETLARLDAESLAKEKDPKARNAMLPAVELLTYRQVRGMTAAGEALARLLERCKFAGEKPGDWKGTPARVLRFELGLPPELDEKQREYVKKHAGTFEVWIAADGTPLATRTHDSISGRAFLFLTFQIDNDEDCTLALVGDHIVATRRETKTFIKQGSDVQNVAVTLALKLAPAAASR